MNRSDQLNELAKALCNVQKLLKPAAKDANNPFFKSKYADLNSIWDACRDLLGANGLSVVQTNQITLEGVIVETVLLHSSGQFISGELYLPLAKHDAQGVGSAITYGRRYGLASMLGIVADEDDDGNYASRQNIQNQKTVSKPPQTAKAQSDAKVAENAPKQAETKPKTANSNQIMANESQQNALANLCQTKGLSEIDICQQFSNDDCEVFERLTFDQAADAIRYVSGLK